MNRIILSLTAALCISGAGAQTLKVYTEPDRKGKSICIPAYLPAQDFRIEFRLIREDFTRGELSEFTPKYFNSADYVKESGTRYTVKNVEIIPIVRADSSTLYYLAPGGGTSLAFSDAGILRAVNMNECPVAHAEKRERRESHVVTASGELYPLLSMATRFDTVLIREISPDSTIIERRQINRVWVRNESEALAKEIIEKINDIREKKYFLVTGPEDVMIDGEGIRASLQELNRMERQYLDLFFGHRDVSQETRSFVIRPGTGRDEDITLGTFSYAEAWNGDAFPVKVTLKAQPVPPSPNSPAQGLPVAVPAMAEISVSIGNTVYASEKMPVTQKGSIQYLPVENLKKVQLLFNEKTGALLNIGN